MVPIKMNIFSEVINRLAIEGGMGQPIATPFFWK